MKVKCLKVVIYIFVFYMIFSNVYGISSKNVTVGEVEYIDNEKEQSEYTIEISWDNMNFTYNETKDIKWDNRDKTYNIVTENEWINENNEINIKNFSDNTITIILRYEQTNRGSGIIGKFNKDKVRIAKNKQEEIKFSISGKITSDKDEYIKVGRINIIVK